METKIIYRGFEIFLEEETAFPTNSEPFDGYQGFVRRQSDGLGKSCGLIWPTRQGALDDATGEVDLLIDNPGYARMYGF